MHVGIVIDFSSCVGFTFKLVVVMCASEPSCLCRCVAWCIPDSEVSVTLEFRVKSYISEVAFACVNTGDTSLGMNQYWLSTR